MEIQNSCYLPKVCVLFLNNNNLKGILILRAFQDLSDLVNCSSLVALGEKQLSPKRYAEGEFQKRTSLLDFYVLCSAASPNYFTFYKYSQRQTWMNEGQKQFNCKIVSLIKSNSWDFAIATVLTVAVPSTEEMDTGFADLTVPLKKDEIR